MVYMDILCMYNRTILSLLERKVSLTYGYGIAAGFLYGAVVGTLKYIFIWKKLISQKEANDFANTFLIIGVMASFFINIGALLLIYFIREMIPFDFAATIISAAVGLSIFGRSFSIHKIMSR